MKVLKLRMLVFLESELFNISVNTRQERELIFIVWEDMCILNTNTIKIFIPLHTRKGFDDVETVALALCALLILETMTPLAIVLPKTRLELSPACRTALTPPAPKGGCSQLLFADSAG